MSLDWVMLNLETLLNLEKKFKVQQIFLDHQMRHFETYRLICAKWDYDENWTHTVRYKKKSIFGVHKKNQKVFTRFGTI
jgi:hypothetical protein